MARSSIEVKNGTVGIRRSEQLKAQMRTYEEQEGNERRCSEQDATLGEREGKDTAASRNIIDMVPACKQE